MAHPKPVRPSAEALKQGYEPEGVHFWTLIASLAALAITIAVVMAIAMSMIQTMTRHDLAAEKPTSDIPAMPLNTGLPPLQPTEAHNRTSAEDLVVLQRQEDNVFGALGWKLGQDNQPQVPDDIVAAVATRQSPATKARR